MAGPQMMDPGPPGANYPQPIEGPGLGEIAKSLLFDPLVLFEVGTGLVAGRGITASLFRVRGGVLHGKVAREASIQRQIIRTVSGRGKDYTKLVEAEAEKIISSSKYAKMDLSKMDEAARRNVKKKIRNEAVKRVNADALSKREMRKITRGVDKRMQHANLKALQTPGGPGSAYRRGMGHLGRGLRAVAGVMILSEIGSLVGGAVINTIKEGALRGREIRTSDNLNPYADFGQSQEAYTQRMEALQAMQRLPGMMRRMGNEARMYHS